MHIVVVTVLHIILKLSSSNASVPYFEILHVFCNAKSNITAMKGKPESCPTTAATLTLVLSRFYFLINSISCYFILISKRLLP